MREGARALSIRCLAMVQKARVFHERDEPEDRVMLAKITHSVGEVRKILLVTDGGKKN